MIVTDVIEILKNNIRSTRPLEYAGVFFGLVSVLYERKGRILVFPTGIISVLIYIYLCFQVKLYADMGINAYYFVMSIYGWYYWLRRDQTGHLTPITTCNREEYLRIFFILTASFIIIYILLKFLTDSDVAVVDSLTTAIFFAGMILMARKKIENWVAWMAGNFISIPLFFYKGLVLTSIQFFIFFILSISGYFTWKKLMQQQPI